MSTVKTMNTTTESPCIGICSTVYGDDICRGCKRNYLDVIHWNTYAPAQKQQINQKLQAQIEKVMADFIVIQDAKKLKSCLDQVALRPCLYDSPFCWAYELLRLKATQISCLAACGICAKPTYDKLSANGLFTKIDDQIYVVATTAARS